MLMYERIRNLRQDKDFTQTQMAEWLSVGQSTYSDYELGKLNIPLPTLVRIAQILGTPRIFPETPAYTKNQTARRAKHWEECK